MKLHYFSFNNAEQSFNFNHNIHRDVKKKPDGTEQVKVVWPKFKNGEATVCDVKVHVEPNFGKMQTIWCQNGHEIIFGIINAPISRTLMNQYSHLVSQLLIEVIYRFIEVIRGGAYLREGA